MIASLQKDTLQVEIYPDRSQMGQTAAKVAGNAILALLEQKEHITLMFAAAPSQNEFLASLAADKRIDWGKISVLQMDDYMHFDPKAPQGFACFLRDRIFSKVNPAQCLLMHCDAPDVEEERKRYSEILKNNPPDIAFIGIGENGHIAFNDPYECDFADTELVRTVDLSLTSREQQVNDGCFAKLEDVPKVALTVTVPAIFSASKILCMVPGPTKTQAVYDTLNTEIANHCPATILRKHPDATLYLDKASAKLLLDKEATS